MGDILEAASVRVAGPEDAAAITRVINAAFRVEEFFIDGDRTDELTIREQIQSPGTDFLVIDEPESGLPAATVYLEVSGSHGHFGLLAVDPRYQGQGLARRLVGAVEARSHSAGCDNLTLDYVNLRKELPGFYAALGYHETGETFDMPGGVRLKEAACLVRMAKMLRSNPDRPIPP